MMAFGPFSVSCNVYNVDLYVVAFLDVFGTDLLVPSAKWLLPCRSSGTCAPVLRVYALYKGADKLLMA